MLGIFPVSRRAPGRPARSAAFFYVAAILARRVDEANRIFVQLTNEIQEKPRGVIDLTIKKMQRLLGASGQTFAYAGSHTGDAHGD